MKSPIVLAMIFAAMLSAQGAKVHAEGPTGRRQVGYGVNAMMISYFPIALKGN
jgi:hypothetical protein